MDFFGYHQIKPLEGCQPSAGIVGPVPEVLFLEPKQLIINEEYQRSLSKASLRQIKQIAQYWDWKNYKVINVAKTEYPDFYEVIDGQHTAIGAITHGGIFLLPCLLQSAETLKDKASGFLGINTNRTSLTKMAIFNAEVAAQDELAIQVACATSQTGVNILGFPPSNNQFSVGETIAIATLKQIVKDQSPERLVRILKICVTARAAPVSSALLKALDIALPLKQDDDLDTKMAYLLESQGVGRLEILAKNRTAIGSRTYETLADMIADICKLPEKRMGRPKKDRNVSRKSLLIDAQT